MDSFSILDSIKAKYEFAKFREMNNVYFSYKYLVSDAALKYIYILQRIEEKLGNSENKKLRILELGCGDGHLMRILNLKYNLNCTGFDPILKSLRVKFSIIRRDKLRKYGKLLDVNHENFSKINYENFDIIYDSCSLTHFNTGKINEINLGWHWAIKYLPTIMNPSGSFICATDTSDLDSSSEFLKSQHLLNAFSEIGKIQNINLINTALGKDYFNKLSHLEKIPFVRISSTQDKIKANVLGFEVKFN